MASNAQKLSAAAEFIQDAPPGETPQILNGTRSQCVVFCLRTNAKDIRTILDKDTDHEFAPALGKYNTEQLTTFKTKENDRRVSFSLSKWSLISDYCERLQ